MAGHNIGFSSQGINAQAIVESPTIVLIVKTYIDLYRN